LEKEPRQSGLLTPSVGHSSQRGFMVGGGFFWAINRSYDLTYRAQYFSAVGLANSGEFRAAVNDFTRFNISGYGLNDNSSNPAISTGGYSVVAEGKSKLPHGWDARGHIDLLSSLTFRQEFSETLTEAIQSETHSVGYLTKHFSNYGINFVGERTI